MDMPARGARNQVKRIKERGHYDTATLHAVLDAGFLAQRPSGLLPAWSSFLGWQVPALLVGLGVVPVLWLWSTHPRRLSGPEQLVANITGMVIGGVTLVASAWALLRAFP